MVEWVVYYVYVVVGEQVFGVCKSVVVEIVDYVGMEYLGCDGVGVVIEFECCFVQGVEGCGFGGVVMGCVGVIVDCSYCVVDGGVQYVCDLCFIQLFIDGQGC